MGSTVLVAGTIKPASERLAENCEDFGLVHQQILFAIDFDVFASVAGEENVIADLDLQLRAAAVFENSTVPDADDFAPGRSVFGAIRQIDPTNGLFLLFLTLNDNAISEGNQLDLGLLFRSCSHLLNSVNK